MSIIMYVQYNSYVVLYYVYFPTGVQYYGVYSIVLYCTVYLN